MSDKQLQKMDEWPVPPLEYGGSRDWESLLMSALPDPVLPLPTKMRQAATELRAAIAEKDARIAELEQALAEILLPWPSTQNPNCGDYERGYAQATAERAMTARKVLVVQSLLHSSEDKK